MFAIPELQRFSLPHPQGACTFSEFLYPLIPSPLSLVAVEIEGKSYDLSSPLPQKGCSLKLIYKDSPKGIEILRHTTAHLLAYAVKELFPSVQVTIGPVIDNGFYYDFFCETPFQESDLQAIEKKMHALVKKNEPLVRHVWSRQEAIDFFHERGESFKVKIIVSLPEEEPLSIYQQGNFWDLCRGPHLPSTGYIGKGFCLTKLSGAYWRGDSQKEQLQRIYGTAWSTEEDLQAYLHQKKEAEKRDHRRLGKEMSLFHFQEEAPGSVFWHPKGWTLYTLLQSYIQGRLKSHGYEEVNTPQLVSRSLWEASGHWEKFKDNMFFIEKEKEGPFYGLKPMNCPCHIQIFNQSLKSYRDLPYRMAEFGRCMRNEESGARHGLMRVTSFVQDDAHIFCTLDQIISETKEFCDLLFSVYHDLGFHEVLVRLSTRPKVRLGSEEIWDKAEEALKKGADEAGLTYTLLPEEGAFYGPKLEFALKDSLGRLWQCGTLQVDFVLPDRLKAFYVASDGSKQSPVMLHRAILGSFERFIGVLLEHTGGHLPLWLAPIQAVVMNISDKSLLYAQEITSLLALGRVVLDSRNEKISYKIREQALAKIPYAFIVGEREKEQGTVVMRHRHGEEILSLEELKEKFHDLTKEPHRR